MEQVDAVADAPDGGDGPPGEGAQRPPTAQRARDDERREPGAEGEATAPQVGVGQAGGHHQRRERAQRDHARHAQPAAVAVDPAPAGPVEGDGRSHAEQDLAGPHVGAVVEAVQAGAALVEPGAPRHGGDGGRRGEGGQVAPPPPGTEHGAEDQGGEQVELLLDRQRPVVQHRRGRLEPGGVAGSVGDELPVGHVGRRGRGLSRQAVDLLLGRHRGGVDPHQHEPGHRGREQAADPPGPERRGPDAAVAVRTEQDRRDQEPGEGEEHRDPEEATPCPAHVAVVGEHEGDRHGTEAVERRLVAAEQPAGLGLTRRARRRHGHPSPGLTRAACGGGTRSG